MPDATVNYPPVGYFIREGRRYDVYFAEDQIVLMNGANYTMTFDVNFDFFNIKPSTENHAKILIQNKLKK